MQTLYHSDNDQVELASSADQYREYLAVELGGVAVPIEFDQIDYIGCGHIQSHPAIMQAGGGGEYRYPDGHYVRAKGSLSGNAGEGVAVALHEDDDQVSIKSTADQYKGYFAAEVGGVRVPIVYDDLEYLSCDTIASAPAIIDVDSPTGYQFSENGVHYVEANTVLVGADSDKIGTLLHSDQNSVRAHSSIDQFRNFLSAEIDGVAVPIEYDFIDFISCDQIKSHPVIVDNGTSVGYYFGTGEHSTVEDIYPMFDYEEHTKKPLPGWAGDGEYESYEQANAIVNFDDAGLGFHAEKTVQVGQDYLLADEFLPAQDMD